MAIVIVNAGICGFETRIVSQANDLYNATLKITSACPQIQKMAEQLRELSALSELGRPINQTTPYQVAAACKAHTACPVPGAILKAMEVATGMALPADVSISIRKE